MTPGNTTGAEDVLDGHVPALPTRQRRGFTRRRDPVIALAIFLVVAAAIPLTWGSTAFARTESHPGAGSYPVLPPATDVPATLREVWRAPSPATWHPITVAPLPDEGGDVASTVLTGAGGEVDGRDPETGAVRWSYRRDLPLCGVSAAWKRAVAVYRTDGDLLPSSDPRSGGGCSEMTSLKSTSGEREDTRDLDAEVDTHLLYDGVDYLTTTGQKLLLTYRSDLVLTNQFGTVPAIVNPDKQPRTDCTYHSVLTSPGKIGVIERCQGDTADRLTVLRAAPADSDKPEELTSQLLDGGSARIVAMNDAMVAVVLPNPDTIVVYTTDGQRVGNYPVTLGASDLAGDPVGGNTLVSPATGTYLWFTGSRVVALGAADLCPQWTVEGALGPGVVYAGRVLVPVAGGLAVIDQADGSRTGTIPVDRGGYTGPVTVGAIGSVVLEQRGETLVALR
ncbi:hypothetical protein [Actinokineospora enzanensis]|uniref:Rv3212 family protein n=1 Tax=Actinokineospora enzanensis TaxID=155975 RepID=UPI000380A76A|nr:hypothetical protein [Actinokineospora enzanensis]